MIRVSTLLFVLLLGAGCKDTGIDPNEALKEADKITNVRLNFNQLPGKWTFTGYLKDKSVPASGEATIEFTESESANVLKVGGRAFVNFYGSTVSYKESNEPVSTIEIIAPISTTKMSGPPDLLKAESNFLNNLKNVTKFTVENTELKLFIGEPASEIIYFKK